MNEPLGTSLLASHDAILPRQTGLGRKKFREMSLGLVKLNPPKFVPIRVKVFLPPSFTPVFIPFRRDKLR
jgi:hypothetical protein